MHVAPVSIARLAAPVAGLGLGTLAIAAGGGFRSAWLWAPDLLAGVAFFVLAGVAWPRHRRLALIAAMAGSLWFAGSVWDIAVFWHRGPLVHLLLTYPDGRASDRVTRSAVIGGYVAASVPSIWGTDAVATALAAILVALTTMRWRRERGRARAAAARSLEATILWAVVLLGGAVARAAIDPVRVTAPTLALYGAAIVMGATILIAGLVVRTRSGMADYVIDLAERRSEAARAALARAVGDRSLRVGYGSAGSSRFIDDRGAHVPVPGPNSKDRSTVIETADGAVIMLVHETDALDDARLRTAVTRAAQLGAANAQLQARVRADIDAADASRQRLLTAGDDERRRLGDELETTVHRPLRTLLHEIDELIARADDPDLRRARHRLEGVRDGIERVIAGLHPLGLDSGLISAVRALASRAAVAATVTGAARPHSRDVEIAAYYVCAEAITNAAKHAPGAAVRIDIADADDALHVTIRDDGPGGADLTKGTGLVGVADRTEAAGGSLVVASPGGGGTTITTIFSDAE